MARPWEQQPDRQPMRGIPVNVNSMCGAVGRLRWLNSDPSGAFAGMLDAPFWGRNWVSDDWFRISWWMLP